MTLLIYLLFLSLAADVLYKFPYLQITENLANNASGMVIFYIALFALDIGIVWIFAIAALHWPIWNYYHSSSNRKRPDQKTLTKLMLPHQDVAFFNTSSKTKGGKKWITFLIIGLSMNIVFSVAVHFLPN